MNEENINDYRKELALIKKCISYKCLMCVNKTYDAEKACIDFSCPLWQYYNKDETALDYLIGRADIYIEMCKKIYETK